jgi:hypothetical protein
VCTGSHTGVKTDADLIAKLPKLKIISNFGVGYDTIDVPAAVKAGVIISNTPDVLNEEVADTALGLLLMTVRELSAAERHLRAGRWATEGNYPLSPSLRDRTVGIVGLGRIGMAIARRLDAMRVAVVYHARRARADAPYRYYDNLRATAADVDVLHVIVPGTAATRHLIDAGVLEAQGRFMLFHEAVAIIVRATGLSIEAVFLFGYLLTSALLWWGLVLIGRHLFRSDWATVLLGALLTLRHREGVKRQKISQQLKRTRAESVQLVKVKPGEGV